MLEKIPEQENIILYQIFKTSDHFLFKNIYPENAELFLHKDALPFLINLSNYVSNKYGYKVCIFDSYRPLRYQKKLKEISHDDGKYVSSELVAYHTRGIALDLAFYKDGKLLPYPPFVHDEIAHHGHSKYLTKIQIKNREKLKKIMIKFNFEPYKYEWWHYNFKNWEKYPILDIDFDEIKNDNF